ncbi:MAG: hypothetical protein HeimC2_32900 [Candidatus Heimdallarchaeota archaeon LC_2]|nr:MAG: hypothetical protein HeimC2_32900 [Candidatus Heimdallarchaeota archaeon LC_2]
MKKNKLLNFGNRQFVRYGWGYQKFIAVIGMINTTAYIVTALAVSNLVEFTWELIIILFIGSFVTMILLIFMLSKAGVLQNETIQTFNERQSKLWKKQITFQSALTAQFIKMDEDKLDEYVDELYQDLFR